jgi:opacity protein-like surface antigen
MTATRSILILGAIATLAAGSPVSAADLGGSRGGSIKDDMPVLMQQSAARFYVRADGSYANYDRPSITVDQQHDLYNTKIDGNWSFGGGVGYYFNKNIRADLTFERRQSSDVTGTATTIGNGVGDINGRFGLKTDVYLANMYYDFESRGRFTPYVGAGLGVANHKTSTGSFTDNCGCTSVIESGSHTTAAAALMAGVAINLTGRGEPAGSGTGYGGGEVARNLYLDLGYRFLYLGDAETGAVRVADKPAAPAPAGPVTTIANDPTVSSIHAHEFRVGLRYDFR